MSAQPGRRPRLSLFWKVAAICFGWALILLGIVGLFLPILQGWLMILGGLALLSPHSRRARAILTWLKEKLGIRRKKEGGQQAGGQQAGGASPGSGVAPAAQEIQEEDRRIRR